MDQSLKTPATRQLEEQGIPFRIFVHPGPIRSLEQAALERGQEPDQVIRSLLFRLEKDEYVMVLIAGKRQVSWPMLRQYLGRSRLTMASEAEVLQVTGYPTGAVSPFGVSQRIRLLADRSVFVPAEISIGSGLRGVALILQQDDFRNALVNCEVVDLVSSTT